MGGDEVELVIFDCDGVLVDSERLAVKVDVEVMALLGWRITEAEAVERFVGLSEAAFRAHIESHLGRQLPKDWERQVEPLYRRAFEEALEPVDGIVEVLDALTLPSCVASSGSHEKMRVTLGLTGLYHRFAGRIFSATEVAHGKPAPDIFLHAAAKMRTAPSACVVVEDSVKGVTAARTAGMRVFGYAGGVTPAERLERAGAVVFDDMRELPRLLRL